MGVLRFEALLAVGYGGYLGVETFVTSATEPLAAVVMAVFAFLLGGALFWLSGLARRGRRTARAPILVWQMLQASIGLPTVTDGVWLGLVLVIPAASAAIGAVWPLVLGEE